MGNKFKIWWLFANIHILIILIAIVIGLIVYFKSGSTYEDIVDKFNDVVIDTFDENLEIYTRRKKKFKGIEKKNEKRCREIFESTFNKPFPTVRPDWLKNPETGRNLELDGFCEELSIAFEYDGEQHCRPNSYFHKTPEDFINQTKRDDLKDKICKERGIKLIRIPSFVAFIDLERYIVTRLRQEKLIE